MYHLAKIVFHQTVNRFQTIQISAMKPSKLVMIFTFSASAGILSAQKVGIGTTSPVRDLHIKGDLRIENSVFADSTAFLLGTDENGDALKIGVNSFLNAFVWKTNGNMARPGFYIGTNNEVPFAIRVNRTLQTVITPEGRVGFGTDAPERKMVLQNSHAGENSEMIIRQVGNSQLGAFLTLDNTANSSGRSWSIGSSGPQNTSGIAGSVGSFEFYQFDAPANSRVRMIINPNGNVGIGTNTATDRLHVVGGIRMESSRRVATSTDLVAIDNVGLLSRIALSEIRDSNAWARSGNALASGDFLGSLNGQPLRLATSGIVRMTITPTGKVGVGVSAPEKTFQINGLDQQENAELLIRQGQSGSLGAYLSLDNTTSAGGKFWSIGVAGNTNSAGLVGGAGSLEFYQADAAATERVRMIIAPNGNIGINQLLPTARLHVNGTVRFSALPIGSGNILVIGNDGLLYRSGTLAGGNIPVGQDEDSRIALLEQQILQLQQSLEQLRKLLESK